jgi:predicted transcriptional regulator of viral defense system
VNRGAGEARLSHDTALDAYEVCDINPDRIHLTVRPGRRIRRARSEGYAVHHETLTAEHVGWWQRIPTVTLPTAIDQCIRSGVPTYLLRQAIAMPTTILGLDHRCHRARVPSVPCGTMMTCPVN